jgi:hypothetical protein
MGKRLRVVGWLRFSTPAQRTRGLRTFATELASGGPYPYDASCWQLAGTDARIGLDVELPESVDHVERAFMHMAGACAYGYVDYCEDGNERVVAAGRAPVKRWSRWRVKRRELLVEPGTSGVNFHGDTLGPLGPTLGGLSVRGLFRYPTLTMARATANAAPFRLPFLTATGVSELRLELGLFVVESNAVQINADIRGVVDVLHDPVTEAMRALSDRAMSGEVFIEQPGQRTTVEPEGAVRIGPVPLAKLAPKPPRLPPPTRLVPIDASIHR